MERPDSRTMADQDAIDVEKCLSGDSQACESLVSRHVGTVRAVCLSQLGPGDGVDDVVQDSFLKAWKSLSRLRDAKAFGPWIRGIARHTAIDLIRSKSRRRRRERPFDSIEEPEAPESSGDLSALMELMPADLREVIVMKYVEGHDYGAMSDLIGISKAGINARMTKARRWLRKRWIDGECR